MIDLITVMFMVVLLQHYDTIILNASRLILKRTIYLMLVLYQFKNWKPMTNEERVSQCGCSEL